MHIFLQFTFKNASKGIRFNHKTFQASRRSVDDATTSRLKVGYLHDFFAGPGYCLGPIQRILRDVKLHTN